MRDKTGSSETAWQEEELSAAALPDKRLVRRSQRLLDEMSAAPGKPIPAACGDWAPAKAAYRFFDNPRLTEHSVLAGPFRRDRGARCDERRSDPYPAGHDRIYLQPRAAGQNRLHQNHQRRALQGRAAQRAADSDVKPAAIRIKDRPPFRFEAGHRSNQ
ncbi:transposase, partial [Mesorhizobium sp. M0239]|uniref:IS4/Tn5 family transposase DNA-binding protein n=1 Tax=Mesorhizobium sp. M0239 TaxID=2956924 RepID=UPI00333B00B4